MYFKRLNIAIGNVLLMKIDYNLLKLRNIAANWPLGVNKWHFYGYTDIKQSKNKVYRVCAIPEAYGR